MSFKYVEKPDMDLTLKLAIEFVANIEHLTSDERIIISRLLDQQSRRLVTFDDGPRIFPTMEKEKEE